MDELRYDGRVAVVTGAGRGIGREHALLLARRGASLVVNDLGCEVDGTGSSQDPASSVVEEICAAGGTAVADFSDVRDPGSAEQIIGTAIDTYGQLDILINNAGILLGSSFADLKLEHLNRLIDTHFYGTAMMCMAAWPHLRKSSSGRIVNTTSSAVFGCEDAGAYGAAKAAVFGLTRTLALEGAADGVHANCIAPGAWTRMAIASGADEELLTPEAWKFAEAATPPAANAGIVGYLVHESCALNGEVLVYSGHRVARWVLAETEGILTRSELTPELLASELDNVMALDQQHLFKSVNEQLGYTMGRLQQENIVAV